MAERAGWPESVELELHGFAQGGAAVGRWHGRPVFAHGGLPGERVRVRLSQRTKSHAQGQVAEVLRASPARTAPPGLDDPRCAGCDWRHVQYETQLQGKAEILRDQLVYLGRIADPEVRRTLASAPWGYRSTARLHIEHDRLGFYAPKSRRVQPIDHSPLLHPLLNSAIAGLLPLLPIEGLREVSLRASLADQRVMGLCKGGAHALMAERAQRWSQAVPSLAGVGLAEDGGWLRLSGADYLYEQIGEVRLRLSPVSFFQANVPLAEALLAALGEALALRPGESLLDAYCGVGTFLLPLTQQARLASALGLEENPAAAADATASALAAGLEQARISAGRVETLLPELLGAERFSAALLDPPRRGVEPRALEALIALCPARIAYVSCHPGTLARDLRALVEGGYRLRFAQPFDFFPQTSHVESLALLDWGGDV